MEMPLICLIFSLLQATCGNNVTIISNNVQNEISMNYVHFVALLNESVAHKQQEYVKGEIMVENGTRNLIEKQLQQQQQQKQRQHQQKKLAAIVEVVDGLDDKISHKLMKLLTNEKISTLIQSIAKDNVTAAAILKAFLQQFTTTKNNGMIFVNLPKINLNIYELHIKQENFAKEQLKVKKPVQRTKREATDEMLIDVKNEEEQNAQQQQELLKTFKLQKQLIDKIAAYKQINRVTYFTCQFKTILQEKNSRRRRELKTKSVAESFVASITETDVENNVRATAATAAAVVKAQHMKCHFNNNSCNKNIDRFQQTMQRLGHKRNSNNNNNNNNNIINKSMSAAGPTPTPIQTQTTATANTLPMNVTKDLAMFMIKGAMRAVNNNNNTKTARKMTLTTKLNNKTNHNANKIVQQNMLLFNEKLGSKHEAYNKKPKRTTTNTKNVTYTPSNSNISIKFVQIDEFNAMDCCFTTTTATTTTTTYEKINRNISANYNSNKIYNNNSYGSTHNGSRIAYKQYSTEYHNDNNNSHNNNNNSSTNYYNHNNNGRCHNNNDDCNKNIACAYDCDGIAENWLLQKLPLTNVLRQMVVLDLRCGIASRRLLTMVSAFTISTHKSYNICILTNSLNEKPL